jgi:Fic family protein
MRSFAEIQNTLRAQPPSLGARLARIDTGRGREQLFAEQLPQVLIGLAETTRVASIQASTAIEGYEVPDDRAERLARAPEARFRNRNEKEFAGYRDAIDRMMRQGAWEPISPAYPLILCTSLHTYTTGETCQIKKDQNYIASYENGQRRIVFTPVAPKFAESFLRSLIIGYNQALDAELAHPLLLLGLFVLDFLAIHPIPDGNGRVARLLTTHELLRMGYGVARYVSVEQLIFDSKNSYYDALEASQRSWHDGEHDPWPWLTYLVGVLHEAYGIFESKLSAARNATGSKADQVRHYVLNEAPKSFRFAQVQAALPGISEATVRHVLTALRVEGKLAADRGPKALWRRV